MYIGNQLLDKHLDCLDPKLSIVSIKQVEAAQEEQDGTLDWNKGYTSLWRYKYQENPELFESDCQHGKDCHKINRCNCTPIEICHSNDKERELEWKNKRKENSRSKQNIEDNRSSNSRQRSVFDDIDSFAEVFLK